MDEHTLDGYDPDNHGLRQAEEEYWKTCCGLFDGLYSVPHSELCPRCPKRED